MVSYGRSIVRGLRSAEAGTLLETKRRFTSEEVIAYVKLIGDDNPIHVDDTAAKAAGFSGIVVPGLLCASLLPGLVGTHFPGTMYLKQTLAFRQLLLVDEEVVARAFVDRIVGRKMKLKTSCTRGRDGAVVVDGEALALLPPCLERFDADGR